MTYEEAVKKAVDECIEEGILKVFRKKQGRGDFDDDI